jgi:rod shape determining protein RodA
MTLENGNIFSLKKAIGDYFDLTTFFVVLLLLSAGLISIYSASFSAGHSDYFFKQLKFATMGFIVMFIVMMLPEKIIRYNSYIIYGITLFLLIAVIFIGTGKGSMRGWFNLGGFSLQPSEFAKPVVLLVLARYLSSKGVEITNLRNFLFALFLALIPALLIAKEPDFGSATVFGALFLGILLWTGFDISLLFFVISLPIIFILSLNGIIYFAISIIIFSAVFIFFKKKILFTVLAIGVAFCIGFFSPILISEFMPHQRDRINTFLNPGSDPKDKGYNVIQATLAVGNGGITGKGFLHGTQTQLKYIPEQRTDFIYCVPTEEFGFMGGSLIIFLLAILMYRAVKLASETNSQFFSVICIGVATIFLYHTVINIGMVISLMPVMGIPLPFMSYGGSSLISNMILIGLMLNAYRTHRSRRAFN